MAGSEAGGSTVDRPRGYVHHSPSLGKRKISASGGGAALVRKVTGGGGSLRSWVSGGGGGGTSSRRSTTGRGGGVSNEAGGGDGEFTELGDGSDEERGEPGTVVIIASPGKDEGGKVRRRSLGRKNLGSGSGAMGVAGPSGSGAGGEHMVEKEVGVVVIGYGEELPREVSFRRDVFWFGSFAREEGMRHCSRAKTDSSVLGFTILFLQVPGVEYGSVEKDLPSTPVRLGIVWTKRKKLMACGVGLLLLILVIALPVG